MSCFSLIDLGIRFNRGEINTNQLEAFYNDNADKFSKEFYSNTNIPILKNLVKILN